MSLLDKATIITTPTAHSNGVLHSIKGGSVADFDVVRGSAATRVNAEGLIEDISILSGELVTNGDFSNGSTDWTLGTGWSIGEDKAISDGTSSNLDQFNTFTSGTTYKVVYTIEDYISGDIRFRFTGASNENGTLRNSNGTYTEYIKLTNTQSVFRFIGSGVLSITNISVVEVIDATNIPRIDYTDGTASILLEPQSTNVIDYSEDFSDAYWSKLLMTATDNSSISPSGNVNASLIQEEIYTNSIPAIKNSGSITGLNGNNTLSFYVKNNSGRYLGVSFGSNAQRIRTNFDFDTETFKTPIFNGTTTGSVSFDKLGDYYRILITANFTTATDAQIYIIPLATDTYPFYAFQNSDNRSFYLWGAQLEALPYSTSYIPTSGAIATRLADSVSGAGDATTFNSTEGVLYFEGAMLQAASGTQVLGLSDGSGANRIGFQTSATANQIRFVVDAGGNQASEFFVLDDITDFNKLALKWKQNDFSFWVNGIKIGTDTSGNVPALNALNTLDFYYGTGNGTGIFNFYGKVKSLITFDTALTDAELECLTTI